MKMRTSAPAMTYSDVSLEFFKQVARTLESASSWVLFSHQKLDGDALGTASALFEAGVLQGKNVRWMGPDPVPPSYAFLPHVEEYVCCKEYVFDSLEPLYIFLDSANDERGVRGLRNRAAGVSVLNIDHHEDNSRFGTQNCVVPEASSTAEILWHIMKVADWSVTPLIAECLYTGIVADTGGFMFSNTTAVTHRIAADLLDRGVNPARLDSFMRQTRSLSGMHLWGIALGRVCCWGGESQLAMTWLTRGDFSLTKAIHADTESLVNQMLLIQGVRFAVLFTEEDDGVKVSFRSKEGAVTAASVARALGGGGHPRASGATLPLPLAQAIKTVREAVETAYAGWTSADR